MYFSILFDVRFYGLTFISMRYVCVWFECVAFWRWVYARLSLIALISATQRLPPSSPMLCYSTLFDVPSWNFKVSTYQMKRRGTKMKNLSKQTKCQVLQKCAVVDELCSAHHGISQFATAIAVCERRKPRTKFRCENFCFTHWMCSRNLYEMKALKNEWKSKRAAVKEKRIGLTLECVQCDR